MPDDEPNLKLEVETIKVNDNGDLELWIYPETGNKDVLARAFAKGQWLRVELIEE